MYLDAKAIKNNLTLDKVTKVVMSLGSQDPKTDSQGNLIFQSVCHGSDSWKLYYYHEGDESKGYKGRLFHCYSGCSESFDIVELVIRAMRCQGVNYTWYKALRYVATTADLLIESNA